jgi:hypothetical protein
MDCSTGFLLSTLPAFGFLFTAGPILAQPGRGATDSTRAVAFDRLDRTARALTATARCARAVSEAFGRGIFGSPDSVGRTGQCFSKDGRAFGAFLDADSTYEHALRLSVVDLARDARYLEPVDTAAMLAQAMASRAATRKGFFAFARAKRRAIPLSLRSEGDTIEVWLLPADLLSGKMPAGVGGERGFIYSPDGRSLAREIDAFDRYRTLAISDSGAVEIQSQEDDLPLVSELIAADRIHFQGRKVRILTKSFDSRLTGPPESAIWIHVRRR